jgi:hypothetical protein
MLSNESLQPTGAQRIMMERAIGISSWRGFSLDEISPAAELWR